MNNHTLAHNYLTINQRLYDEATNPLRSHGPDHHRRVYERAMQLAEGKDVDLEILTVASLLHDIAAYYPDQVGDNYHQEDPKRARRILEANHFNPEKIDAVIDAIANHGSDKKYADQRCTLESVILCDADKLDVFGPIGVARIMMVKTLRGASLEDIVKDFVDDGHLQRKRDAITLPESR